MAMWVPVDPQPGMAVVPREQQPLLPILWPAPAALQLEDVLDVISAVCQVDTSAQVRRPISREHRSRGGPRHQRVVELLAKNAFDSLTPPSIGLVLVILAGRGLGHFGPRSGDMEYLTSAPFAVPREDVLPGDWGEFWQGFDDGHGCNGFLNDAFVVFEHPLVAGVLPSFDEDCSARLLFLSEQ
ncbi:hypothetical protein FOZ62_022761 [Perkinsus olseni]|uniref:Uncharacterized protein n=1 Tax=Perkinsus olseni TaxID=32597 RepID=A0A7J6RE46_PEROL|nr:hypothetical protein FOZ62_022761 [Perkinsus olseni]